MQLSFSETHMMKLSLKWQMFSMSLAMFSMVSGQMDVPDPVPVKPDLTMADQELGNCELAVSTRVACNDIMEQECSNDKSCRCSNINKIMARCFPSEQYQGCDSALASIEALKEDMSQVCRREGFQTDYISSDASFYSQSVMALILTFTLTLTLILQY